MIPAIFLLAFTSASAANMEPYIVGGKEVTISQWPFMTFIHVSMSNHIVSACGGSLISSQTVLTAAHCVDDITDSKTHMRIFQFHIYMGHTSYLKSTMVRRMLDYTSHSNYDPQDTDVRNDIAVMFLNKPVKFGPNVKKVLLLQYNSDSNSRDVEVAGWGATAIDEAPSVGRKLKAASLSTVNLRQCRKMINTPVDKVICTKPSRNFAYSGDSGGPLMVLDGPYQIGIVSFRDEDVKYTVYTSVPAYYNWIEATQHALYRKYCPNKLSG